WLSYEEADEKELEKLAKNYRTFLDAGKTERECVLELTREAESAGYVSLENKLASGEQIKAGDKIYAVGMKKIMSSGNNDFDGSRSSAGSDSTSDCLRSGYTDPSGKNA
ncbi:hypothetical protein PZH33_19970, partial [Blautia schinkii]|nr:hypothetical protein [Blautia schinkii]